MSGFSISEYEFDKTGMNVVGTEKYGKDWPFVYLIHNDEQLYIGETQNAYKRFDQHLKKAVMYMHVIRICKIIYQDSLRKVGNRRLWKN